MFKSILVGLDGGKQSERVLAAAIDLAKRCKSKIHLASIIPARRSMVTLPLVTEMQPMLNNARAAALKAKLKAKSIILFGVPAEQLAKYARKEKIDLIVLGRFGKGFKAGFSKFLMGSVSKQLNKIAPCSVLTIK